MVTNRFSQHSIHNSLEAFHNLKQNSSVTKYINKFEEMMGLMQMDYPGLNEQYFVSSFIAGLREGIKHYLIPHNPQNLCETITYIHNLLRPQISYLTPASTFTKTIQKQRVGQVLGVPRALDLRAQICLQIS
jgi:hypothetical protein